MFEGHRERLRNRFLKQDLDGFEQANVLELLLFFSVGRRNTIDIAHRLIDKFGNIANVFDAPFEELTKVEGVGAVSATLIKLVPSLSRYYIKSRCSNERYIESTEKAGDFILPHFIGVNKEIVLFIGLDAKSKILSTKTIFEGTLSAVQLSIRKIVQESINSNITRVIIAHNHPGGIALPSKEDLTATAEIEEALSMFDIKLLDHIIVADNDYVSLAQSGYIKNNL